MSAKRVSIGQVMMAIALAAVNLAVIRVTPWELVMYPAVWVLLGCIDFVIVWKLILRRSLRAFHYTFLIVFFIAFFVMANFVAMERLHPLGLLVRWYQHLARENTISISRGFLRNGEFWMASFLSLTSGCLVGLAATWLERRRGWDIAAFLRGALVGFGVFTLLALIDEAEWGGAQPSSVRLIGRMSVLGACLILGGLMGLSRLKSEITGQ
ncbi:MAG: hypothetical protein ACLQIB_43200 [Isosphaeraceae bacterium]